MRTINLDRDWRFREGTYQQCLNESDFGKKVNLPHDYMIESEVKEDATAKAAMGFYTGVVGCYTKILSIPADWEGERVLLYFDGVMLNASVEINGCDLTLHHYGYTPFSVDISSYLYYGENNRIMVRVNPSMQPNSRWYTGAGIYRSVTLIHTPKLYIAADGIFLYTRRIVRNQDGSPQEAHVCAEVTLGNDTPDDRLVDVSVHFSENVARNAKVLVKAGDTTTARIPVTVIQPRLWDAENPYLYQVTVETEELGIFRSHLIPAADRAMRDVDTVSFGIRTVTADAIHGLCVNGQEVKLKGGCIHHDNGLLGAVSLYDSEYRKIKILKDGGFNCVRTAHNPPSAALLEACDRIGMYVFNEAFDAWGVAKQPGDYSQYFRDHWKEDLDAFVCRDRNHPSVLFWSTGNEIPERGGLNDGYHLAMELAEHIRKLDPTRLISNGLCTYWSGLDDKTVREHVDHNAQKNAELEWEKHSEPFAVMLDVVGYNYMDYLYETHGKLYPERVILGTESFPMQIDRVWDKVERLPYVIGDCTWTCFDYIGEAGIGKAAFLEPDENPDRPTPSPFISAFPWRLANDADYDINGNLLPQGVYRRIVWGSRQTGLYSYDPADFDREEWVSAWGWPAVSACWNWKGQEGKPVKVVAYSSAQEVELRLNDRVLERKAVGKENRYMAVFDTVYEPGVLTAVSFSQGQEISSCTLHTTGVPAALRLTADRQILPADGHSVCYVAVEIVDEEGRLVPDTEFSLQAEVTSPTGENSCEAGWLAGFGSSNPITTENYTARQCTTYQGRVMAILRSGYEPGDLVLMIRTEGLPDASLKIHVE
ncbi:MAG: glycoside hydrolase family 2 protein [Lachnospiraceae bacterium]|nr:glycoside hydrolase family 2 protein [Lachnospiraceae bacterium]